MKIVVISPTYNEKVNMGKMIPVLEEQVFPQIKKHDVWLLIADDSSPDGTADIVREAMKKWKKIVLLKGDKKGLGAAYVRAMRYAMDEMKADAVIEFDADFQHDPNDIPRLIAAMDEGYDYVIGSRYIPGGQIPKEWGFHRKFMSFFGGQFARFMLFIFTIHDMTSGFKLTKTKYLRRVDLEHLYSMYYAYKMQILYEVVNMGAKVKEVPIVFYERKEGSSKIEKKDLFDSFWVVTKLRWRDSKRLIKFLIVGGTGFILQFLITHLCNGLRVPQATGVTIGGEVAILSNFFFNNFWTFTDTKGIAQQGNFITRLLKFNVTSLFALAVQFVVTYIAVLVLGEKLHLFGQSMPTNEVILFPTIILIVIPMNYLIYNKLIWKTQYLKHERLAKIEA